MSSNLKEQIYRNMNLKDTEELLEIWRENDRVEWSDTAFEVVKEILVERIDEIPNQNPPINEYTEEEKESKSEDYGFTELELKIIDDENPPEFYDPLEVLKISKWLEWAVKAFVVVIILYNLLRLPEFKQIVESFFWTNPNPLLVFLITMVFITINSMVGIAINSFLLITLSRVLKILLQMEFNSRLKQN